MTKVISANYRDRTSKFRWLVRDKDQRPENAIACQAVSVFGKSEFVRSSAFEEGFGCRVVIETNAQVQMEGVEPIANATALEFDGYHSFLDPENRGVWRVSAIELDSDGKILAKLP